MPNGFSAAWTRDRTDPRVIAALEKHCPACDSPPGEDCGWQRPTSKTRKPLTTGVVHYIRVPIDVLFGTPE